MLRLELERLGEIALEVGDALARDPVDQVERDVVEAGVAEGRDGGANIVGARAPLERSSRCGWKLCAPSETRSTPCSRRSAASSVVTVSGFASTVVSAAGGKRREQSCKRGGLGERRCAAAEEDGLDLVREQRALELQFCKERVDVATVLPAVPVTVTKSQ